MWPILPATSHLRLRSGGFFTPPGGHVPQRFPDRTQSRQTRMKVLLVVELLILLILVVYGWGPGFQTWARRRKRHIRRRARGVGAGVPLLVPSLRVASPGQRAAHELEAVTFGPRFPKIPMRANGSPARSANRRSQMSGCCAPRQGVHGSLDVNTSVADAQRKGAFARTCRRAALLAPDSEARLTPHDAREAAGRRPPATLATGAGAERTEPARRWHVHSVLTATGAYRSDVGNAGGHPSIYAPSGPDAVRGPRLRYAFPMCVADRGPSLMCDLRRKRASFGNRTPTLAATTRAHR